MSHPAGRYHGDTRILDKFQVIQILVLINLWLFVIWLNMAIEPPLDVTLMP